MWKHTGAGAAGQETRHRAERAVGSWEPPKADLKIREETGKLHSAERQAAEEEGKETEERTWHQDKESNGSQPRQSGRRLADQ